MFTSKAGALLILSILANVCKLMGQENLAITCK
jgi:hypothetical protein